MKAVRTLSIAIVVLAFVAGTPARAEIPARAKVVCASVLIFVGAFASREHALAEYERVKARGEAELIALPFRAVLQGEHGVAESLDGIIEAELTEPPNLLPQHLLMSGSAVAAIAALAFARRRSEDHE